jgi:hypothetical protein
MSNGSWSNTTQTRIIVVVGTPFSGIFFYDPTIGPGNLVASWTVSAGTDPYGNTYPAGFSQHINNSTVVDISAANGITFTTPNPNVDEPTQITAQQVGAFASAFDEWDVIGPRDSTNTQQWFLTLRSASQDLTQAPQAIIRLLQGAQTVNALLCDFAAAHLLGEVTAVQPATGTSTIAAVAETWHSATSLLSSLWTTTGVNNPLRYRIEGIGPGRQVRMDGLIQTTGVGPWPANANIFTFGTGYIPALNHHFVTRSAIAVAADTDTVTVVNTGGVQNGQTFTAAGQKLYFDGITFPLD